VSESRLCKRGGSNRERVGLKGGVPGAAGTAAAEAVSAGAPAFPAPCGSPAFERVGIVAGDHKRDPLA
jgi:hypothetical protein